MGSWIAVNAVFIELPIFVNHLPEGWNLPSYLSVVVQIANIGPLVYTVWSTLRPEGSHERVFVFLMVSSSSFAVLLLAFLWKETSKIGGEDHSTALLVLTFILSFSACMSSVVFLPFMSRLKVKYMAPFFVGMGLSGLLPSLISLVQGVGRTECRNSSQFNAVTNESFYKVQEVFQSPKIPVKYFYFVIYTLMLISGISFALLNFLPYCKTEHININDTLSQKHQSNEENQDNLMGIRNENGKVKKSLCIKNNIIYLIVLVWINALLNGVLLSVQSYACLPYGKEFYHYFVTGSKIVDPVAGFLNFFIVVKSGKGIGCLTITGSVFATYIVVMAAMSPTPAFLESSYGGILVVSKFLSYKTE
jgi:riboflavin transporter 2